MERFKQNFIYFPIYVYMDDSTHAVIPLPSKMKTNTKPSLREPARMSYADFMKKYQVHKGTTGEPATYTNTRIGDGAQIHPGKYNIPEEEYGQFLSLYHEEIVAKQKPEYLTELQLKSDGPILVDLDFRFDYSLTERKYTKDHIDDLVNEYLEQLKTMYQFDENTQFQIFVLEKPHINRVKEKQITKDGIHLIIGIKSERRMQIVLRKRVLEKLREMWGNDESLPLVNPVEEVLDEGITNGGTPWQLYGSGKPNHEKYALTYIYHITGFDTADAEFRSHTTNVAETPVQMRDYIHRLSARYSDHPVFFYTTQFANTLNQMPDGPNKRAGAGGARGLAPINHHSFHSQVVSVRNQENLEVLGKLFLDSLTDSEYEIRETWEYTMVLPVSYYGEGSYSKWIRVGWALRNIDDRLFILWVVFSAQAQRFDYQSIPEMYEKWLKFDQTHPNEHSRGLTKRSIMHWAREDARADFLRIRENSTDLAIERSLGSFELIEEGKPDKRGCTDYDIASILYQLYKSEYVCSGITQNTWYKYEEPRWVKIDAGVYLRKHISKELRAIYSKKAAYYVELRSRLVEGADAHKIKQISAHADKIMCIYTRLGNTNDKKNIMTEAKELFYNDRFEENLDANPYLICFKNGVVDFKQKVFRRGTPEDYLTKCTHIDYIPNVYSSPQAQPIIAALHDFMAKLFPEAELNTYMWEHLASTLIGILPDQTWNIYIGEGQNGKSVLVKLMERVLGDYKGIVPLSLLTDSRTKIGGTSPEVVGLQGLRYAVMQEPTKGQRVNEGVMKQLVSGIDPIQARGLYMQHAITFYPQFKLVLCSNYLMDIRSNDRGTWRRIRVVPFKSLFTEKPVQDDPEHPYQFKAELGIEERTAEWQEVFASMLVLKVFETEGRVKDCEIVLASSNEYRKSQDSVAEFISENVVADTAGNIRKTELTTWFNNWLQQTYGNSKTGPSLKDVVAYMDKKYKKDPQNKVKAWMGCRLLDDRELQEAVDDSDMEEIEEI